MRFRKFDFVLGTSGNYIATLMVIESCVPGSGLDNGTDMDGELKHLPPINDHATARLELIRDLTVEREFRKPSGSIVRAQRPTDRLQCGGVGRHKEFPPLPQEPPRPSRLLDQDGQRFEPPPEVYFSLQ